MAQAQNVRLLSRTRNLEVVRDACRVTGPIEFDHVVELVKARVPRHIEHDCHAARDHVLLIAATWDLNHQLLDEQSDECLAAIVAFIG
jgi:hypothetical protein